MQTAGSPQENEPLTLRDLRSRSGKTAQAIASEMSAFLRETPPRSHASVLNIERLGTDRNSVRDALAFVYKIPRSKIDAILAEK